MKHETTRKFIYHNFECKRVGYADLYYLLQAGNFTGTTYFTHGVYGWNFDAYCYGGKCITMGYRNLIGERVDDKLTEKYNKKARAIWENRELTYDKKQRKIDKLVDKFFTEAFKEV